MTNSDNGRGWSMMATVNGVLDDLHGSLGLTDSEFFCECGRIGCRERMTLTRAEYARLREEARPVMIKAQPRATRAPPANDRRPLGLNASHDTTLFHSARSEDGRQVLRDALADYERCLVELEAVVAPRGVS